MLALLPHFHKEVSTSTEHFQLLGVYAEQAPLFQAHLRIFFSSGGQNMLPYNSCLRYRLVPGNIKYIQFFSVKVLHIFEFSWAPYSMPFPFFINTPGPYITCFVIPSSNYFPADVFKISLRSSHWSWIMRTSQLRFNHDIIRTITILILHTISINTV